MLFRSQLEKNHVAPPSSQDEPLGRYSVSRVPSSHACFRPGLLSLSLPVSPLSWPLEHVLPGALTPARGCFLLFSGGWALIPSLPSFSWSSVLTQLHSTKCSVSGSSSSASAVNQVVSPLLTASGPASSPSTSPHWPCSPVPHVVATLTSLEPLTCQECSASGPVTAVPSALSSSTTRQFCRALPI